MQKLLNMTCVRVSCGAQKVMALLLILENNFPLVENPLKKSYQTTIHKRTHISLFSLSYERNKHHEDIKPKKSVI